MKNFLIALQFLTRLPVKITFDIKEKDFGRSLVYFPVVGMLIGLGLALITFVFQFLPSVALAALIIVGEIIVTGGIHLDGLADTCDGFYAGKSKEEILKIMRDPHVGVMGGIGIVSVLLLKLAFIAAIPADTLWKTLIVIPAWGRFSQVLSCYLAGYPRDKGKAKAFIEHATKRELFIAATLVFTVSVLLLKVSAIIISVLLLAPILLSVAYAKKKIGGMTGDSIGAVSEITEVMLLFLVLLCAKMPCF